MMSHAMVDPLVPHFMSYSVDSRLLKTRRTPKPRVDTEELEKIRSKSREKWREVLELQDDYPIQIPHRSSYTAHYTTTRDINKNDYRSNPGRMSPARRNRPHPSMSFMVFHQHNAPGFAKVKGSGSKNETLTARFTEGTQPRDQSKLEYQDISQAKQNGSEQQILLETSLNNAALPRAESWMRHASTPERNAVLTMLKVCNEEKTQDKRLYSDVKPVTYASLNRCFKEAGREEKDALIRLMKSLSVDPYETGYIDRSMAGLQDPDRYKLGKKKRNSRERSTSGRKET